MRRSDRSRVAQFVGCGMAEAEELKISGDQLEQHVAADLNSAALVLGGPQEWSDLSFEHHIPDVGTGCDPIDVDRQWVTVVHPNRGGVDDQVVSVGILRSHSD